MRILTPCFNRDALAAVVACVAATSAFGGCGRPPPPLSPSQHRYAEPHWQDALDAMPELLIVVLPKGLRQDKVYGGLLRRAIEVARERSRVVAATRVLDAMEDADEIVAALSPEGRDHAGDLLVVVRGVRAEVDPAKLVDSDGHLLWETGPSGRVRELVRERDDRGEPIAASLFELPGRTWVIAAGDARARARDAFAHPFNRPSLDLDPAALAIVRIDGPSLVARLHALQPHGALDAVGRRLRSATLALPPGGEGVIRTTLSYGDEDAAAVAEVATRQAVEAIVRAKRAPFAWLAAASVQRHDRRVVVTAPLPPQLVDGLLRAGAAPLDLDIPPP